MHEINPCFVFLGELDSTGYSNSNYFIRTYYAPHRSVSPLSEFFIEMIYKILVFGMYSNQNISSCSNFEYFSQSFVVRDRGWRRLMSGHKDFQTDNLLFVYFIYFIKRVF